MRWITTCKLHYLVTDINSKFTDLIVFKCKRIIKIRSRVISSSQVVSSVVRARQSFHDMKLELEYAKERALEIASIKI